MELGTDSEKQKVRSHQIRFVLGVIMGAIIFSLIVPWWGVFGEFEAYGAPFFGGSEQGMELLAPAYSPFQTYFLGTKLSSHFLNVLILLLVSFILTFVSWFHTKRRPALSPYLLMAAASFSGIAILFFSIFFPRVGYFGPIFWPFGSGEYRYFSSFSLSWFILPGILLALSAFILQVYVIVRMNREMVHQEESEDVKPPTTRLRKFAQKPIVRHLVFPVCCLLIATGVWAGASYSPIISAGGFLKDWDIEHKSFGPGDQALVVGTVTNVTVVPTSYGDYTFLTLDEETYVVTLKGDRSAEYPIGRWVSVQVHFRTYWYNGNKFTWAEEGYAPLPMMWVINIVFNSVSHVMGSLLLPDDANQNLKVYLEHGLPLEEFNVSLVKGDYPYIGEMGAWREWSPERVADQMVPLQTGSSKNGMVTFTDVNGNGLLDYGDIFDLDIPPTVDAYHFDTYMLCLYGPMEGQAYLVVGSKGPLLFYLQNWDDVQASYFFAMPPDQLDGDLCSSRVEISNKLGPDTGLTAYSLSLSIEDSGRLFEDIPADTERSSLDGGIVVRSEDGGITGILDTGDAWIIENLTNGTEYIFRLFDDRFGDLTNSITWICGIGHNVARRPRVSFSEPVTDPIDPQKLFVNVSSVEWLPVGPVDSYGVVLLKNETNLLPSSEDSEHLDDLPLGPSGDGAYTWLSFNDTDGNGYLGPGDTFVVNNTASQSRYEIRLYYHRDYVVGNVSWTT